MCLHESVDHIIALVHLCMNDVKYEYVCSTIVMLKVCSHVYTHTHMNDDLLNRAHMYAHTHTHELWSSQ